MSDSFFDKNKSHWHYRRENAENNRGYDTEEEEITSDVLGSYTGIPLDDSRPIQDADDL